MMCDHAKELIAASWLRELNPSDELSLKQHLTECGECSAEMSALGAVWERLGDLPAPEPSRALDVRWQATLESFTGRETTPARKWRLADLWPKTPAWQAGIAFATLLIGLAVGALLPRHDSEIAQLRQEVTATRQMVALSLMQQGSATQRLKGVDYSGRMAKLDPDIVSALVAAVDHDPSVNVRLAAIDALGKAAGTGGVLASMTQSLREQDSPMVQAALIDYLMDARDRKAIGALQAFEKQPNLNPAVLERAHYAVQELTRQ
jgi:hypothetical protein